MEEQQFRHFVLWDETLRSLNARLRRVRPARKMSKVLLLHDNPTSHTKARTVEAITGFGRIVLPHSHCILTSHHHIITCLTLRKRRLRRRLYDNCWALQIAVRQWLKRRESKFTWQQYMPFFKDEDCRQICGLNLKITTPSAML